VDMVLSPIAAYTVDIMETRSAESMAASMYAFNPKFFQKILP
jgi:hypothetical protein